MRRSQISNLKSQIFLVGFMASGKSTVGPVLARRLKRPFLDLDPVIEGRAGCTIAELISREGEEEFRRFETDALRAATLGSPAVVAVGGGAIIRDENRQLMSQYGIMVWLDTPFEICWRRIQEDKGVRPLAPTEEVAHGRYIQRLPFYRLSGVSISINLSQTPEDISETIITSLRTAAPEATRPPTEEDFTTKNR
jgi:shikimate kinase